MYGEVVAKVDSGKAVDVIYLDLSKAFDVVSHEVMIETLMMLGFWPKIWVGLRIFLLVVGCLFL